MLLVLNSNVIAGAKKNWQYVGSKRCNDDLLQKIGHFYTFYIPSIHEALHRLTILKSETKIPWEFQDFGGFSNIDRHPVTGMSYRSFFFFFLILSLVKEHAFMRMETCIPCMNRGIELPTSPLEFLFPFSLTWYRAITIRGTVTMTRD